MHRGGFFFSFWCTKRGPDPALNVDIDRGIILFKHTIRMITQLVSVNETRE